MIIDLPFPLPCDEAEEAFSGDCIVAAFEAGNAVDSCASQHTLTIMSQFHAYQTAHITYGSHSAGMQRIVQQLEGRFMALAVIDHVVSTTAVVVPVQKVVSVLRKVSGCVRTARLLQLAPVRVLVTLPLLTTLTF